MSPPPFYAGLDTAVFPGLDWARQVYNGTNIWYLGYYLGGQNAAKGTETWLGNRAALVELGFGLIPIYVGQQVDGTRFYNDLTPDRGAADGRDAARLMRLEGFPRLSVCYLDIEDRTYTEDLLAYVSTWGGTLKTFGFRAGVYCDATPGGVEDALLTKTEGSFSLWAVPKGGDIWISVTPEESESGYLTYPAPDPTQYHQRALGAQWAEATGDDPIKILGVKADLSSFVCKDPSMPDRKEPDVPAPSGVRPLTEASRWLVDKQANQWSQLPVSYAGRRVVLNPSGYPRLMPTADEFVAAIYELKDVAPYRVYEGGSIPMWVDDGWVKQLPPISYFQQNGIMCLTGETNVIASGIERSYKRVYNGEVVAIKTASGKQLTATPNHPVLTRRGWIAANSLQKGDHVVCCEGAGEFSSSEDDVQGMPTPFEKLHDSLVDTGTIERVPRTSFNFHGDRAQSDVDVVYPDGFLRDRVEPPLAQEPFKLSFPETSVLESSLKAQRVVDTGLLRSRYPSGRRIGRGGEGLAFSRGSGAVSKTRRFFDAARDTLLVEPSVYHRLRNTHLGGDMPLRGSVEVSSDNFVGVHGKSSGGDSPLIPVLSGLRPITDLDASSFEASLDSVRVDSEPMSEAISGLSGCVRLDKIVGIERKAFSGHVYNLQTTSGKYIANGIVTHNCSDLVTYGLVRVGVLAPNEGYGTEYYEKLFEYEWDFQPGPGIKGAVGLAPYVEASVFLQGHLSIYDGTRGGHGMIQALVFDTSTRQPGVTNAYTDDQTRSWGSDTNFTKYGLLRGLDYSKYLNAA